MDLIGQLKNKLDAAADLEVSAERGVAVAAVIAEALQPLGQDPVLVGGAAVEFYTQGGYATADIDLVTPGGEVVAEVMIKLGFKRLGKDFIDERRQLYIEFPSAFLRPGEQVQGLQIGDVTLQIIALEDLIVDRLCAYKFWKSGVDGLNSLLLLELGGFDESRLALRAQVEEVDDALQAVHQVREQVIRQKLDPQHANQLLEQEMLKLSE